MKQTIKSLLCIVIAVSMIFCFSSCSSAKELTEDSATETVELAVKALQEFNTKDLKKYVDSKTLDYIIKLADEHSQFAELGKAMFECLSIKIISVDIEQKTVTAEVINRDLFAPASNFAYNLTSNYSNLELLSLLDDEFFLDNSLKQLTDEINTCPIASESKIVTLKIVEGKRNFTVEVDEEAEDAISGGALYAVKGLFSK